MTIRLQNLLVIPPIFLILGLAVGLLADRAAREEIVWGLEEESVALAVTVAEMTGGAVLDRILSGDSATAATVRRDLARIGRYGQAESIILYSRVQDGSVVALHRDTTAAALEPALWEEQRKAAQMLGDYLAGRRARPIQILVKGELIHRATTARAPKFALTSGRHSR